MTTRLGIACEDLTWEIVQAHERAAGGLWLWHPPDRRLPEILRLTARPDGIGGSMRMRIMERIDKGYWAFMRQGRVLTCTVDGYPIEVMTREYLAGRQDGSAQPNNQALARMRHALVDIIDHAEILRALEDQHGYMDGDEIFDHLVDAIGHEEEEAL